MKMTTTTMMSRRRENNMITTTISNNDGRGGEIQTQKPSTVLRMTKFRQIKHSASDGMDGRCARGALASYYLDWNGSTDLTKEQNDKLREKMGLKGKDPREIASVDGIISLMNDNGKSLNEIADWLERIGY